MTMHWFPCMHCLRVIIPWRLMRSIPPLLSWVRCFRLNRLLLLQWPRALVTSSGPGSCHPAHALLQSPGPLRLAMPVSTSASSTMWHRMMLDTSGTGVMAGTCLMAVPCGWMVGASWQPTRRDDRKEKMEGINLVESRRTVDSRNRRLHLFTYGTFSSVA